MNKTYLYEFLEKKKRVIIKDLYRKISEREEELYQELLKTPVGNKGDTVESLVTDMINAATKAVDFLVDSQQLHITYDLRNAANSKIYRFVVMNPANISDQTLKNLNKEKSEVSATFAQLEGVVKNNTPTKAFKLLTELGFEIPPQEKALLPAIKVDVSKILNYEVPK